MRGINAWKMEKEEEETSEAFAPPPRGIRRRRRRRRARIRGKTSTFRTHKEPLIHSTGNFSGEAVERANVREVNRRHQRVGVGCLSLPKENLLQSLNSVGFSGEAGVVWNRD